MKELETLPADIYKLFDPNEDHVVDEENLSVLAEELKAILRKRLAAVKVGEHSAPLRFSALGRPDRQIWYKAHAHGHAEQLRPKDQFKFLYGDFLEILLLFLTKEAGHTVEQEQAEVDCDGVKGHIDAVVDGVVVDVKSASPFGYKKFKDRMVEQDDPFGYVQQLAGYASVLTPDKDAAWLAFDKVDGSICVTPLSKESISHYPPSARIAELREIISGPIPPRCYPDIEDGKSGNRKLGIGCSYCAFKNKCWPSLRTFIYSTGPRFLTQVGRIPDVPEVFQVELDDET